MSSFAKIFANAIISRNENLPFGANGIAINNIGDVFVANTGDGAINILETDLDKGTVDAVFIWRKDPRLIGVDGIKFDKAGNLWIATNRRNAIMAITPEGEGGRRIIEVAKNDNMGPLEFPSSVAFAGESLYITNFDVGGMGDNEDNSLGIGPSIVKIQLGVEGLPSPA